jgi:hypothetical protein
MLPKSALIFNFNPSKEELFHPSKCQTKQGSQRTLLPVPSTPRPYIPFAFASKTLTASEPLLGTPFGFGMERMPFSLFGGVFPLISSS